MWEVGKEALFVTMAWITCYISKDGSKRCAVNVQIEFRCP